MATINEVRDALALLLKTGLEMEYAFGRVPSPIQPLTVFVIPTPGADYVTFDDGTFCRPMWRLSAVIVGPTSNYDRAAAWLDAAIILAPAVTDTDPTLAGRISNLMLAAVTEPGMLETSAGPFLAAELRLHPFFIA